MTKTTSSPPSTVDLNDASSIVCDTVALSGELRENLAAPDHYNAPYKINFGIARGLDYPTGMVFEMYAAGSSGSN